MTTTILTIAGSLRRESLNRRLLAAARHVLPGAAHWAAWDGLAAMPPFDQDAEQAPVPEPVTNLRTAIAGADAVLIATPEYNGSVPGVLKNAIDWASRPREDTVLRGKPVAVIGASPTPYGATWAQADLRRVLGIAGADVVEHELAVPQAFQQFDEHDRLLDAELGDGMGTVLTKLLGKTGRVPAIGALG